MAIIDPTIDICSYRWSLTEDFIMESVSLVYNCGSPKTKLLYLKDFFLGKVEIITLL